MTELLLSRLHHPVHSLGYGRRAGIWFQGCTVYCRGCVSRDTWPFDPASACAVDDVLGWLAALPAGEVDGVTISGGEPTDQPAALAELLGGIRDLAAARAEPIDVLLYSGREAEWLEQRLPWLPTVIDTLVSGPYEAERAGPCALRGSANQHVHTYTELARSRYPAATLEQDYAGQRTQLGVHVDASAIWLVGIPLPGDLRRLTDRLDERGIELTRTSWLT